MTDIFTQEIKNLIKLATVDFDEFYKQTEKKSKSSGYSSKAASSGYPSKAASSGDFSACSALGYRAAVKGGLGNLLMASEYKKVGNKFIPIGGKADLIDGTKLKPEQWYIVEGGKWVPVDFTDGIFSRVLSTKNNIKKVKDENGDILYIVKDGEHSAHGATIKEAREALLFKTADRDISTYNDITLETVKTPTEWAVAYHVITGACQAGCMSYMKSKGKLKKSYTLAEILGETKGAYGYEKFSEFVKGEQK